MAVCLLPGTEVSFANRVMRSAKWPWTRTEINYKTAVFRQINKGNPNTHHDALEFANSEVVLLTTLAEGQQVTVLQLPAKSEKLREENEGAAQRKRFWLSRSVDQPAIKVPKVPLELLNWLNWRKAPFGGSALVHAMLAGPDQ